MSSQLVTPAYAAEGVSLTGPQHSREGYFQLQVSNLPTGQRFIIEQSANEQFSHIDATYSPVGSFQQLSLSGFDNGSYFFRARILQNEVSQPIDSAAIYSNTHQISIQHYSLWQALGLFALGAVLFIILITVLLRLHWQSRRSLPKQPGTGHG